MQRILRYVLPLVFIFISFFVKAQNGSHHIRISVLTCAPGDDLYSLFGHSAIRIIDSATHNDLVFNWGTFDFADPDFYIKFTRGKLMYMLSVSRFNEFMTEFLEEKRSVYEQELNLTAEERNIIHEAIQLNLSGDNRYYHYDFLFDNCTTRIRDIISKYTKRFSGVVPLVPKGTTFRNMIYEYLDRGGQPWSKLGIDILLGSKIDKAVNNYQSMFLPEYLLKGLDSSKVNLVKQKKAIFYGQPATDKSSKYTPLILFSIIALAIIVLSLFKSPQINIAVKCIDFLLLFITGAVGLLILFMWFGTNHASCGNNYNLLWAMPFNFMAAFFIWRKKDWIKKYFYFIWALNLSTLLLWLWLPQQLNIALIPVILLLCVRSYRLAKY